MSAKSKQPTLVIKQWLSDAIRHLEKTGSTTPRLDAEIILSEALKKPRTFLHSHAEQTICSKSLGIADSYLNLRLAKKPLAYIIGHKEFYGRDFAMTPDVLIPRPESEAIIELLNTLLSGKANSLLFDQTDCAGRQPNATCWPEATRRVCCLDEQWTSGGRKINLIDVGTGSGCLGITAKLEFPHLRVTLTDISPAALKVAKQNAKALAASVNTLQSNLLAKYNKKADIIIANLPYVDKSWDCSPETAFEPSIALFAPDNGLALIKRLVDESTAKIAPGGYLIIESDPRQHKSLIKYAADKSFQMKKRLGYCLAFVYSTK